MLEAAYKTCSPLSDFPSDMGETVLSPRPRELEQLNYTFCVCDVSVFRGAYQVYQLAGVQGTVKITVKGVREQKARVLLGNVETIPTTKS